MDITNKIIYAGVNDHKIDLFEGQFDVPNGMAYNSYVIMDEKVAVCDTVDAAFGEEWLSNLENILNGREPDYLIVHHMEPDHSANIDLFAQKYTNAKIVATSKAFAMMTQFFGKDYSDRAIVAGEGDELSLGEYTFKFFMAPMVHWPEVMVSYEISSKTLFSADAFGKFGALDIEEDWACEARRYYFGIVGKYGMQATNLLKKLAGVELNRICPLHGPVLSENLGYYLDLYNTWTSYGVESEGVVIAYTSVYGNTKKAAELLRDTLIAKGCPKVAINDLARCDMAEAVEDAFRYGKIVLATTTYNSDIFPFMREFINELCERGYKNRKIGLMENGSWAAVAAKVMMKKLDGLKNIELCNTIVSIKSAVNDANIKEIEALADELI